jgi:hypothetical protein
VEGGILDLARRQDDGQDVLGVLGEVVEGEIAFALGRARLPSLSSRDSRL